MNLAIFPKSAIESWQANAISTCFDGCELDVTFLKVQFLVTETISLPNATYSKNKNVTFSAAVKLAMSPLSLKRLSPAYAIVMIHYMK